MQPYVDFSACWPGTCWVIRHEASCRTCVTLRQSEIRSELYASKGSALLLLLVLLLLLGDGELPLLATGTRLPESGGLLPLLPLLSGLGLLLPPVFALFVFEAPARYGRAISWML